MPIAAGAVLGGLVHLGWSARRLNALALGDETAATLGWTVVAVSGAIGFVGLMVPHAARMLVGADHRKVLAVAPLAGAVLLIWVDILSRVVLAPAELPLGVLTAAIGVPCFVLLMRRRTYTFGGV